MRPSRVKSCPFLAFRVGRTQSKRSIPRADHLDEILGRPRAHQVTRLLSGQPLRGL